MRLIDETWMISKLTVISDAFKNTNWVDHFNLPYQERKFLPLSQTTTNSQNLKSLLPSGDSINWRNYFDKDLSTENRFQDLLPENFKWTEYFKHEVSNFPELDAFPCKTDWIQWNDSFFGEVTWKSLPPLPNLIFTFGSDCDEIALEELSYRSSEGVAEFKVFEKSSKTNLQDVSIQQPVQKTFLTGKHYDWLAPTYAATAVAKFRKNIHDTRGTKSAGWEQPIPLNPPEIIEPPSSSCSSESRNSPELLTSNITDNESSQISEKDLESVPKIRQPVHSDSIISSNNSNNSNFTTPTISPDLTLPVLTLLKPFDSNKMGNRPHSSQGLYFQERILPLGSGDSIVEPYLLQLPSTYCQNRRTSESDLPKLHPPKKLKTPPGYVDDSKFWAVKKSREPWNHFDKPSATKSQLKKLKKIPRSRCRSAIDTSTDFNIDELGESKANLLQISPKGSPKKSLEFRFSKNSCKVSPEPGEFSKGVPDTRKGIHSKVNRQKPNNRTRKGKKSFFKRHEWLPVIRSLLKGSLIRPENSAKVQPNDFLENQEKNVGTGNFFKTENNKEAQSQYNVIKYNPLNRSQINCTNKGGGQTLFMNRHGDSDLRRRPYWIRFLRYCNIRKRFGIHRSRPRKNYQQGNCVRKLQK